MFITINKNWSKDKPHLTKYQVHYRDHLGKQKCKHFHRFADARKFGVQKEIDRQQAQFLPKFDTKKLTQSLEQIARNVPVTSKVSARQSTIKRNKLIRRRVIEQFGSTQISFITNNDLQEFLNSLGHNYSKSYISIAISDLKRIFNKALADGVIQTNPSLSLLNPSTKQIQSSSDDGNFLTKEEVQALLETCSNCCEDATTTYELNRHSGICLKPYAMFFYIGINFGLRKGELIALRKDDIDLGTKTMSINKTFSNGVEGPPKTKNGFRVFELDEETLMKLDLQMSLYNKSGYLFETLSGTRLSERKVNKVLEQVCKTLGIEEDRKITIHSLRSTFFALYRDAGYTSEDLYKYAGHSSPLVSERFYSAEYKESLKVLNK